MGGGKVICVDINSTFIECVKNRFPNSIEKLKFYVSSGNELSGIADSSVNLVFSMDTLVRVEKKYIIDYFSEIKRVLKQDGEAILHLPNNDLPESSINGFTVLVTKEIETLANQYFSTFNIDSQVIKHGSMLYAKK